MSVAWIFITWPYVLGPPLMICRARNSPLLADDSDSIPAAPALVTVMIPARDEAHNIVRCVESVLRSAWPALEVIVVNDRSEDDTGALVAAIAARDSRLRVIDGAPVPAGWFGKQWACEQGARAARGSTLIFTDADTEHAPDLIPRTMSAMTTRSLDFFTVAGFQEFGSFWERVIMPQIFNMLAMRYGGAGEVNRKRRASDKVANGQYLCFTRSAYDAVGTHESVRMKAAEDLALAQEVQARGLRGEIAIAPDQLSTRMYTSLAEVVNGWTKNIYVGASDAMPPGTHPRIVVPILLAILPLMHLLPPLTLLVSTVVPLSAGVLLWAKSCSAILLVWWALLYAKVFKYSPLYALLLPLGAVMVLFIVSRATLRGRGVEWKGRRYQAG